MNQPPTKLPLWQHQLDAYHFAYPKAAAMLAMGMGTGKSAVAAALIAGRKHRLTLIVAPSSVVRSVWRKQLETHSAVELIVCAPEGSVDKRVKLFRQALITQTISRKPLVLCINYEAVWRTVCADFLKTLPVDLLILDESHRAKDPSGTAAKYLYHLSQRIPYKLALTGTPMPHSPLDVFAQYRILDPGIYGNAATFFRTKYAVVGRPASDGSVDGQAYDPRTAHDLFKRGYRIVLNPRMEAEFRRKFYSIAFRVDGSILTLPEAMHVTRTASLSGENARLYRELKKHLTAEIRNGTVTAGNALTKLLRLAQIAGGCVKDDDGRERVVGDEKRTLFADILEDFAADEPLVVFCRFHHDLDSVREAATKSKRRYAELSGRTNELDIWQAGGADVLGVQIQSGGTGIDLTRARYAVYYSVDYNLAGYEQSLARIHRPGQTRPVTYIHLVMSGTVEEDIYRALEQRKEIITQVLEGLAREGGVILGEQDLDCAV